MHTMMASFVRAGYLNAKLLWLCNWQGYTKETDLVADELNSLFVPIDVAPALTYNIVSFTIVNYILFVVAGFSDDFLRFLVLYASIPGLVGSLIYYSYRFGYQAVLVNHSLSSISSYIYNFGLMLSMSVAAISVSIFGCLAAVRYVEPFLPESLQRGFYFPTETWERTLKEQIYFVWGLCLILLLSTKAWNRGYHLNLELLGRKGIMSNTETALEIIFTTCQSYTVVFLSTPIFVILRSHGIVFHPVHIVVTLVELIFINRVINVKFFVQHKLQHECKPLYRMTHLEHHVTKGTYVTTAGIGIWEPLDVAGTPGMCLVSLYSVPFALFQGVSLGVNFVVHVMAPVPQLTQWHTLHHTVNSDMYGSNIPTPVDKAKSRVYAKYSKKLKEISPFIKYEWLSDAVSGVCIVVFGLFLHFGLGTGVLKAYENIQWL